MTRRTLFVAATLLLLAPLCRAATPTDGATGSVTTPSGVECTATFLTPQIVRITKMPTGTSRRGASLVVVLEAEQGVKVKRSDEAEALTLRSQALTLRLDKATGAVTFSTADGSALLGEARFELAPRTEGADAGACEVEQVWQLDGDEPIYGLGIFQDGLLNRRGTHRHMVQANTEDYQNVLQSPTKGWALYWDNYSPTTFDDGAQGMSMRSQVGEGVDYYFLYGADADGCVAQLRQLTGQVPLPPLWTFGFWQSKERYKSMGETCGVVARYRQLGIPIDGIVQDWQYWGSNYLWNAMEFLADGFQDAPQLIDSIHAMGAHLMITIWSSFGPKTKGYAQMDSAGCLLDFRTWPSSGIESQWPPRMDYPSGVRCYDPFAARARDIYWQNVQRLWDLGVDAWWMDSTEPDNEDFGDSDFDRLVGDEGFTMRRLRNAYPLASVGGVYTHQRALTNDRRVFIMTRSGFAGQQRYAGAVWSGDVPASWQSLRAQLPAGLNFSLTGNPNFNSDIGGFFAGAYNKVWGDDSAPRNPLYQELYTRWMQYGLFCPVFRSHGTEVPRELWLYGQAGEPVYDALVEAVRLRYRLLPYIYSTAWQVTHQADSYMHPLVARYPHDRRTWDMGDEFLFGPSLLAAPIVQALYTPETANNVDAMSGWDRAAGSAQGTEAAAVDWLAPRQVTKYLPGEGTQWYDFHTGTRYDGGQDVTLSATLATIPLFVPAGSIIPVADPMQHTGEADWQHLELRLFPGADATFTLYEDAGDSYDYEQGAYTEIPISWRESNRTLTLGTRTGSYEGMPAQRTFTIVLPDGTIRDVAYNGKKTTLRL